jgi:hypothetical protein
MNLSPNSTKKKFGLCKNMREIKDAMLKKHEPKKRREK